MVTDTYFFLGKQRKLRDSVARVLPLWSSKDLPLKSYLHGMYAFGLVETNFYEKAEKEARKVCGLRICYNVEIFIHSTLRYYGRAFNVNRKTVGRRMHLPMSSKWKDALTKAFPICPVR